MFLLVIYYFPTFFSFSHLILYYFNFYLDIIQQLPFSYSIPYSFIFVHDVNFTFSLSITPNPTSYQCSSLYSLKIIFLSVGHLRSTLLSYKSLNLFTPLLIPVHVLLIVGLWRGVIFASVVFFPGLCGFVLAAPAQQHTRCGGWSDPQSTILSERNHQRMTPKQSNPNSSREPT